MDKIFDWNRIRAFLATAESGSLSAAARQLGLTQPTLGRQIAALEAELDVMLFERAGGRLQLTRAGQDMLVHVRDMGAAAERVALVAIGQSQSIEGLVRITATDIFCAMVMPAVAARIRALAPRLQIDIVAANDIRDLLRREADIAVRNVRPAQPDLVARLIGEATGGFYAAKTYLDARGRPQNLADLASHDFLAFGDTGQTVRYMQDMGMPVTEANFGVGCGNGIVLWALAQAGLGITVMDDAYASRSPQMERILPDMPPIPYPVWLTTHREIHTSPRIRLVFDVLADMLGTQLARD